MEKVKIGVLRETKIPPDRRVALPPEKILELKSILPQVEVVVQPSPLRCYTDKEYTSKGIALQEDLTDCDILIGVKEVDIAALIPRKTYLFFAHVAKKQDYNRDLLKSLLKKKVQLIDYEYLTDPTGIRLIAFGRWAGIVGAYNALRGYGWLSGQYALKPAHLCHDRQEMDKNLENVRLKNARILISGGGRVAQGALETMEKLGIRQVNPGDYLTQNYAEPVYCRIDPWHYAKRKDNREFELQDFFHNPKEYESSALPYLERTNIYIAAHYWNPQSPRIFELKDLQSPISDPQSPISNLQLKVIADISCDINGSVPTTTRATTIAEPFYWYNTRLGCELPVKESEGGAGMILMMTVDNLPGELPRDASDEFSGILVKEILPRLVLKDPEQVIHRAKITEDGRLTELFSYLKDFASDR